MLKERRSGPDCRGRDTALNEDKNFQGVSATLQRLPPAVSASRPTAAFVAAMKASNVRSGEARRIAAAGTKAREVSFEVWDVALTSSTSC